VIVHFLPPDFRPRTLSAETVAGTSQTEVWNLTTTRYRFFMMIFSFSFSRASRSIGSLIPEIWGKNIESHSFPSVGRPADYKPASRSSSAMDLTISPDIFHVDFKINSILIPPANFQKLEPYAFSSGSFGDVWKCSMSTPSGPCIVSLQKGRRSVIYHDLGCRQVLQDPHRR
jgi:hypothetical protein